MHEELTTKVLTTSSWYSLRQGKIEEVSIEYADGTYGTRYRVLIWDEGREPFLKLFFNDPVPAMDFLEKIKADNESFHNIRR